jgi:hypothetical protein
VNAPPNSGAKTRVRDAIKTPTQPGLRGEPPFSQSSGVEPGLLKPSRRLKNYTRAAKEIANPWRNQSLLAKL